MAKSIEYLAQIVREESGHDILLFDHGFIQKTIARRQASTGKTDREAYFAFISKTPAERSALLNSLLNTYSAFFRNSLTFAYLEQLLIPELITRKENVEGATLRIWSAGCSTGQEAYSLAMLFDEVVRRSGITCTFRIFATDISKPALETARTGSFDADAIKDLSLAQIERYFIARGDRFEVTQDLKRYVDFSEHDLLNSTSFCPPACIFGDLDIAVCSNVLFYYRPEIQHSIIAKLHRCLSTNGFLISDTTERDAVLRSKLFRQLAQYVPIYLPMATSRI